MATHSYAQRKAEGKVGNSAGKKKEETKATVKKSTIYTPDAAKNAIISAQRTTAAKVNPNSAYNATHNSAYKTLTQNTGIADAAKKISEVKTSLFGETLKLVSPGDAKQNGAAADENPDLLSKISSYFGKAGDVLGNTYEGYKADKEESATKKTLIGAALFVAVLWAISGRRA